jgi:hypothetical protein
VTQVTAVAFDPDHDGCEDAGDIAREIAEEAGSILERLA